LGHTCHPQEEHIFRHGNGLNPKTLPGGRSDRRSGQRPGIGTKADIRQSPEIRLSVTVSKLLCATANHPAEMT
jgi:hypothetical protein